MDTDILGLIQAMDKSLSFVEDINIIEDKLERFKGTIENVLSIIHQGTATIQNYLSASIMGMTFIGYRFIAS